MNETLILTVGEADIKQGKKGSRKDCPAALAATRQTGEPCEVSSCILYRGNVAYKLPMALQDAIAEYDFTGKMEPASYELGCLS